MLVGWTLTHMVEISWVIRSANGDHPWPILYPPLVLFCLGLLLMIFLCPCVPYLSKVLPLSTPG